MATQLWNQEIDKTVDWGGDASTGGSPVSGQYVQKFIKDTLAKKFGYLNYDKASLKYQVFADYEDYVTWRDNPTVNADLLLATFDAPAPASIIVEAISSQNVTILSSDKNQKLSFNYYILDSSSNPMNEAINARILFNNGGNSQVLTVAYDPDYDGYNKKDENGNYIGTTKTISIDDYLSVGTNNITVTLTGATSQAQTSLSFKYTVVEMQISSGFDNSKAFEYDTMMDSELVYDREAGNVIQIPYKCSGQGAKYMEVYINGQELHQEDIPNAISFGTMVSGSAEYTSTMHIFITDKKGALRNHINDGKNSLQFRIYVEDTESGKLYSQTLYYDFVVKEKSSTEDQVYILYRQTLNNKDQYFQEGEVVEFSTQQYSSTSFEYSVYSSTGKEVQLEFALDKMNEDGTLGDAVASLVRSLNSGDVDTFEYSFMTYGKIQIMISAINPTDAKHPYDTMQIIVEVEKSAVQISVQEDGRILNLEALNRSNSEPEETRSQWLDENNKGVVPVMKNVYFNSSSGWDGKALVLNNGATLEIPYALFGNLNTDSTANSKIDANGRTIEITFEMVNVQDEDAVMLSFKDTNNGSSIELTASEARITDGGQNEVYTKFNANTKIKMAFIICPYDKDWAGAGDTHNANFICVNGILDKADMRVSSMSWKYNGVPNVVVGDATGKAGIKLYSFRVYDKALSLDNELTNWIAESDDLLKHYNNNTLNNDDWTGSPVMDVLRRMIPTVLIYGDIDKFNALEGKKENIQIDMEFYDPDDDNRDFYARGMWMSPQGTSSMAYPIKNMRPYFSKTFNSKTKDAYAKFYTEVYHKGQFTHGQVTDESTLGHFYTNKKTTKAKLAGNEYYMHKCYNKTQAERLQSEGEQLFFLENEEYIPCTLGVDDNEATEWYVAGYREVKGYSEIDTAWKVICDLRLSGQTLYKLGGTTDIVNEYSKSDEPYHVNIYKKIKGKEKLERYDENGEEIKYYIIQGVWKQYDKSGYTNVWTFKADYAESSMCNNAGTGRLWGDVMKNFKLDGDYLGRTDAQAAVNDRIDIRTSCDGKPIVLFCKKLLYVEDENGKATNEPLVIDGVRQYSPNAEYVGLYNIMTDKSSTPLFGFENIYDENGKKIYDAVNCECWECLSNAVDFPQGLDIATDRDDAAERKNDSMSKRQPLWAGYEVRWPDVDGVSHSHKIESLWRFINFCKDAVDYKIGGEIDGYSYSEYIKVKDYDDLLALLAKEEAPTFVFGAEVSGNMKYTPVDKNPGDEGYQENLENNLSKLYYAAAAPDYNNVTKTVSTDTINAPIYIGKVASWDAEYGVFTEDIQFDDERVGNAVNGIDYGDKIKGSSVEEDYYVTVYLTKTNSKYEYVDNYGKTQTYKGTPDDYERNSKGETWVGKTKMQYFSEKKYDWFNVYRMAAYYIYLMRFAAVDQVVKNSMLTTEDGQHFYYINYDNDTILGVRNDGNLVYHWNITRNTYDYQISAFAFAGPKSVLWNLLENDDDFISVVKRVDNAMFTSNVLSKSIALDMYNNKQEGTWGERLYNINEEIKYLSQWDGSDAKYLRFIHGSSNQYRSWFIENRFNLYDSLWESGDYLTTRIGFRLHTLETDGKRAMFNITAARENKFFLSNSDGQYKDVDAWKMQLAQNETASWPAIAKIQGSSSPWMLYGSDKIKVLDFRPSIGVFELQQFSFIDGYDWPTEKGCLMTGFLIGIDDEYRENRVYRYTNMSAEEQTISGNAVAPGEHYDSEVQLTAPENFIEDVLSPTVCGVTSIGGIGKVYSLEEIDIRNCFNTAGLLNDTLQLTNLSNLHIFRAIGSSITSFEPAIGCNFTEISLPKNRINKLVLNNATFTPSYDEEGNLIPMLKYVPDAELRTLTLKNITMADEENPAFDIVEFIADWIKAYHDAYYGSEGYSLKNLSLALEGVDIKASVEWLKTLKELNLASFTGDVFVVGSNDGALTQDEFDELSELYSNERPFEAGSSLRFSAEDAVFWTIDGNKTTLEAEEKWGTDTVSEYYEILHGEPLKFRSTKFVDSLISTYQNYTFEYLWNNSWVRGQLKQDASISLDKYNSQNQNAINMYLTVRQSGSSDFLSSIDGNNTRNEIRYVKIYTADSSQRPETTNFIYVKINKIVEPGEIVLFVNDTENEGEFVKVGKNASGKLSITLKNHLEPRKFLIRYKNNYNDDMSAEDVNVTVSSKKPVVSLGDAQTDAILENKYGKISDVVANIADLRLGGEFVFTPKVQPESASVSLSISVPYDSALGGTAATANLEVSVPIIKPNAVMLANPYESDASVSATFSTEGLGEYEFEDTSVFPAVYKNATIKVKVSINSIIPSEGLKFPIVPFRNESDGEHFDVNVPIYSISEDSLYGNGFDTSFVAQPKFVQDDDGNWFIQITPNRNADGTKSYDTEYNICFDGLFGYSSWDWSELDSSNYAFDYAYRLDASIIYPDAIKVVYKENNVDITTKALVISASDGATKQFALKAVAYNTEQSDPVTVPVTISVSETFDYSVFGKDITDESYFAKHFASMSSEDSNISIELMKYKTGAESDAEEKVVSAEAKLVISATYKNLLGKDVSITDFEIPFSMAQSISSCNSIDNCNPYKINSTDTEECPWYFVDANNQYYPFKKAILEELDSVGKLNELVGIARRLQYGFSSNDAHENDEYQGNLYNNASEVWKYDPELVKVNGDSVTRSQWSSYRALCIPLANWRIGESILNVNKGSTDKWSSSSYKTLNDTYGSWAVARFPFVPLENFGTSSSFPSMINAIISATSSSGGNMSDTVTSNCPATWHKLALHSINTNAAQSSGTCNSIFKMMKVRDTSSKANDISSTIAESATHSLRLFSALDVKYATKYLCTASVPEWYTGTNYFANYFTSLDNETSLTQMVWPGYTSGSDTNNQFRVSGLVDIWHHFRIYYNDDAQMKSLTSSLRCYPASLYELDVLFNGKGKQHKTGSSLTDSDILNTYLIDMCTESGYEKVPAGLASIYKFLNDSNCLEVFKDKIELFITKFIEYFKAEAYGEDIFGSLYMIPMQGSYGDSLNSIGKSGDNFSVISYKTLKSENSPGRAVKLLMLPLLYVD